MNPALPRPDPTPIALHKPRARPRDPRRPHLFAGRALGETELEQLQAFGEQRIAPLLAALGPGIVQGLDLAVEGAGAALRARVGPGVGVAGDGSPVRVDGELAFDWPALRRQAERAAGGALVDGLYLLTLGSAIESREEAPPGEAAARREADPLRESRFVAVTRPGLRLADASPRWADFEPARAANRVLARAVEKGFSQGSEPDVAIGLLCLAGGVPAWVDTRAARWRVAPDAAALALLDHTLAVLASLPADELPAQPLRQRLGLDFLPAALPLPAAPLLPRPWERVPVLGFAPEAMAVELATVPASTVGGLVDVEARRAPIDLRAGRAERIRLLLAIDDADWRRDLLDWPARDTRLEERLQALGLAARADFQARQAAWGSLFAGTDEAALKAARAAPDLQGAQPPEAASVRDALVERRRARLRLDPATGEREPLPSPWIDHALAPHPLAPTQPAPAAQRNPSVLRDLLDARAEADKLRRWLATSFELLDEIDEFIGLQRTQADAVTAAFSALSGGLPGDGSGATPLRWASQARFALAAATPKP